MGTPVSVFPVDRSRRWIIAPGIASTRQIQIRNDSAAPVELQLKVEEPAAASVSPANLTLTQRQSRNVDVIFLADWSPSNDKRVVVSVRDSKGELLVNFVQEVIAADSSDCSVVLTWKEPLLLEGQLSGLRFYCTITSRSSTTRTFEVDFTPHPSLRFPERKKVTLEPGDSNTFEVPIEWNRSVRDANGWNHPKVIEVTVPVTQGRRTSVVLWDSIEMYFDKYLTDEDRAPVGVTPPDVNAPPFPGYVAEPANEEEYRRLVSLKQLEQAVVGAPQMRVQPLAAEPTASARKGLSLATVATLLIGLAALVVAGILYLRPQMPQPNVAYTVTPVPVGSFTPTPVKQKKAAHPAAHPSARNPAVATTAVAAVTSATLAPNQASQPGHVSGATAATAAAKPAHQSASQPVVEPSPPQIIAPVARNDVVVVLADPDVSYTAGGRAVSVTWYVDAQARALVHLLNDRSVIIGQASVAGARSHAVIRLPHGYNRGVSVEVIAIGYHGERVVQSAYLAPPGG